MSSITLNCRRCSTTGRFLLSNGEYGPCYRCASTGHVTIPLKPSYPSFRATFFNDVLRQFLIGTAYLDQGAITGFRLVGSQDGTIVNWASSKPDHAQVAWDRFLALGPTIFQQGDQEDCFGWHNHWRREKMQQEVASPPPVATTEQEVPVPSEPCEARRPEEAPVPQKKERKKKAVIEAVGAGTKQSYEHLSDDEMPF